MLAGGLQLTGWSLNATPSHYVLFYLYNVPLTPLTDEIRIYFVAAIPQLVVLIKPFSCPHFTFKPCQKIITSAV